MNTHPRRPTLRAPIAFASIVDDRDPIAAVDAAHETAAVLVHVGRATHDPAVTARLMSLVDEVGLDTLAELWASRPTRSLPGVLWRLYVLHTWVARDPDLAAREYAAGIGFSEPQHAVAGVHPAGPEEMRTVIDQILNGVFVGDFGVALDRASALCRVVALGRSEITVDAAGLEQAWRLRDLATDFSACADLWRAGLLI